MEYVVITPVRDEELHLGKTIASMVAQTIRPKHWVIVNDGSTDKTGEIADAAAVAHPWISVVHRQNRGFRKQGGGVIEAFYDGLTSLFGQTSCSVDESSPGNCCNLTPASRHPFPTSWSHIAKLDADLCFGADYFEACLREFDREPRLGIGGGLICQEVNGTLQVEWTGDPAFHVRGAVKIYRRECWDQIGGLIRAPGWDTIDELKANMLGWSTRTFHHLEVHQLKETGTADGTWKNWVKNGLANYITGYHPLFMAGKCAKRLFKRPYGIAAAGLACGFAKGYLRQVRRVEDQELIRYLRQQQLRKLTGRTSIWGRA